MYKPSV